jgi:hypothetical protein
MKLAPYLALIGSMAFASAAAAVAGPILTHEEGANSSESFTAPTLGKEVSSYLHSSPGVPARSHNGVTKTPGSSTNLGLHSGGLHSGGLQSGGLHSGALHYGTQEGRSAHNAPHTVLGGGLGRNHTRVIGANCPAHHRDCIPDPIADPPADDGTPADDLTGDPTPPPPPVLDPVAHDPPTGNLGESDAGGQSYSNSVTAGLQRIHHTPILVPEPTPIWLIGIGLAALLLARRRSMPN